MKNASASEVRSRLVRACVVAVLTGLVTASRMAGAAAQPGPTVGVQALRMPCADQSHDIVGLVLVGSGVPAGTVVVFGQAFTPGSLPDGSGLKARDAAGHALPAQLDVTTRHPDGSARFAVVSLAAPALQVGERYGVVLGSRPPAAGPPPVDLAAALAARQAVIELQAAGGPPWRADLIALLRAGLADRTARVWQSGPLANQARVAMPVPASVVGGGTSLRLVVDISLRADETLWIEPWLRNDVAMQPGGGAVAYGVRILLDGREVLSEPTVKHEHYAAWGRLIGAAQGGRPAPTPPFVHMDVGYLAAVGAVARYDLSIGVDERLLARLGQAVGGAAWETLFGERGITRYMPTTGGRADIGPTTQAQAAWLITGDPRAAAYVIGQAEGAGAVPWHHWDPTGGADGKGGWLDVQRRPQFWLDGRNGPPPRSLLQQPSREVWVPDTAHQPDLSYVPYLLTGRRSFLDGLQAQAAYNVVATWPALRGASDVVVVNRNQVRGAAWGLRQIDEAAWISADADPNSTYLRHVARGNWAWLVGKIPEWTLAQGEAHGWVEPGGYGPTGSLSPWQQDFFVSTVIASAKRGNGDAMTFLKWQSNYLLGRFQHEAEGFRFNDGPAYATAVTTIEPGRDPRANLFKTWSEIGRATVDRGMSNGDGWARGGETAAALSTLAGMIQLLPNPEVRRVYEKLLVVGAERLSPEQLRRFPTYAIMPPGVPRLPARALRCVATGMAPG